MEIDSGIYNFAPWLVRSCEKDGDRTYEQRNWVQSVFIYNSLNTIY